jgi:flagellar hook-associated protein 1 FlgK
VTPNIDNAGGGVVTATVSDLTQITGDAYELEYDGATYTLSNVNSGASVSGAGPSLSLEGVDVTIGTAPTAGDSFLIDPVAQGASLFGVVLSDPRGFAAASPLRVETSLANAGNAELSRLSVSSVGSLPLGAAGTLTFDPDALGAGVPGFVVAGGLAGGPIAYDPTTDANGISVTLGDISFTLSGVPEDGDVFTIDNNTDGSGDNRNALALAALQTAQVLKNGAASYQDAYAGLVADVAVRTRQASSTAGTEAVLLEQSLSARDSAQGVNLDEEAANLIRYQQAYQAAAQVIAVANEVFQTLINATAR